MDRNRETLKDQPLRRSDEDNEQEEVASPNVSTLGENTFPAEELDLDDEVHRQQDERDRR